MASLLEREMFNYFTRLNEDEKESCGADVEVIFAKPNV